MKIFSVFEHQHGPTPDPEAVLVNEGIAWWAIPFPMLWFLYHREWNWALAFFGAGLLLGLIGDRYFADQQSELGLLSLGINLLAGFLGNDLRQMSLKARGFIQGPVIVASDLYEAEQRYYKERRQTIVQEISA